jgi:uncharacterized small protein (DUF1192 family)
MTSIKKPLIAIASAVALVGSVILAGPANAATTTLTVDGNAPATAGTSATTAIALPVPADNSVDSADALKIALTNLTTGSSVVVAANNAKLVTSLTSGSSVVKADAGTSSVTISTGTGSTADLFVYTTSTANGTVTVTAGNATTTYYVKGTAGSAYNLSVVAPATVNIGGTADLTAAVTDVFGNAVTNATISTTIIRGSATAFAYDATDKRYESTLTAPATAGTTVVAHTISASAVVGFAKPVTEVISTITVADLAGQVAALQAELTALKAELDATKAVVASTTKQYNDLAVRWNRKLPGTKWDVQLIK